MINSDERREAAEKLRNLPSDPCDDIKKWQADGLFIEANLSDEADYSQIHNAVIGTFPAEYAHPGDYEELHERLADLIDPTCTAPLGEHEHGWLTRECSACGYTIKTGYRYCPGCGARLVRDDDACVSTATERVCPNCGAHIVSTIERTYDGWTEYCPDCGAELVSDERMQDNHHIQQRTNR